MFFLNYWSILGGREGERADKLARSGAAAAFSWMRLFCYNAVEAFRDDISSVAYTSSARTERKRGRGERTRADKLARAGTERQIHAQEAQHRGYVLEESQSDNNAPTIMTTKILFSNVLRKSASLPGSFKLSFRFVCTLS